MPAGGLVFAVVSNNQDPEKRGRVKVQYSGMGDQMESDWLDVANLYSGAFFVPEVSDQVVVAFPGGKMSGGVILGCVWSSNRKPPETKENSASDLNGDGENNLKFLKSRSGQMIILDDKDGEEKVQIISPQKKSRFEFLTKEKKINIESEENIVLEAAKNLNVSAQKGTMKFDKELNIEAKSVKIESKSNNINFKAGKNIEIKGTSVKLN